MCSLSLSLVCVSEGTDSRGFFMEMGDKNRALTQYYTIFYYITTWYEFKYHFLYHHYYE
jgi:hypothetical protein